MLDSQIIKAKDCLMFETAPENEEAIRHFALSYNCDNIFRFTPARLSDTDSSKVVEYDYWQKTWRAGRYVGNANFTHNNKNYNIVIEPRFGELFLFKMIEEIFNVKLVASKNTFQRKNEFGFLIKRLISFIWLYKLANANKHGLPRHNAKKRHTGYNVKGKINIRETIIPLFTQDKLVSEYFEKEMDKTIARILLQAYWILVNNYEVGTLYLPENAREIINLLKSSNILGKNVTQNEYERIYYKEIYQSFKDVVDFSWEIINNKISSTLVDSQSQKGFSFFIDIAEIWELYIRTALSRHLNKHGWKVYTDSVMVYKDTFFGRHLIPDIVVQRGDILAVFDAKYKNMNYNKMDLDRDDFFQIHTYISYYAQGKTVRAGGLIYPLGGTLPANNKSSSLFYDNEKKTSFVVEGFDVSNLAEFDNQKTEFLNRISLLLDKC